MTENEDDDPVGEHHHDPRAEFTAAAVRAGLIQPGDKLDQNLVDFAHEIVTLAARVADRHQNAACHEDTVGDEIRAMLYEL